MADPLYDLLIPYFDAQGANSASQRRLASPQDPTTSAYLVRLSTLSLSTLNTSEPQSLAQSAHSILRSLQVLSKRSYKAIISSSEHLSHLQTQLPTLYKASDDLQDALPSLETSAQGFSQKYSKSSENQILDRRRKAMLLARNVDRVSDVFDLPTLLSSATSSQVGNVGASTSTTANYASALDIHAHVRRLQTLYPNLSLVQSISTQAEAEMRTLSISLINSLQSQSVKLAGGMRTIGWLRRISPDLDLTLSAFASTPRRTGTALACNSDGTLGALFLVCRLANLISMLSALDPLRELADQETLVRSNPSRSGNSEKLATGQQTERYLKRYIEIFREQSFAIISMYKSIFPSSLSGPTASISTKKVRSVPANRDDQDALLPLPSPLATFPLHLVELLMDTLKTYIPNVRDRSFRDSLLTQVMYCAGSLGRLGGDFGILLALLGDIDENREDDGVEDEYQEEWVEIVKKHRVQANRLELLASGVGIGGSGPGRKESVVA